jgi:ABC-2 type transport system ATP-binding protein
LASEGASLWRDDDAVEVVGISIEQVGGIALRLGALLYELSPQRASLEEAFMRLTADTCEYVAERAA